MSGTPTIRDASAQRKTVARLRHRSGAYQQVASFGYDFSTDYLQAGSPSPAAATVGFVVFMPMPQITPDNCVCVFVAVQ